MIDIFYKHNKKDIKGTTYDMNSILAVIYVNK